MTDTITVWVDRDEFWPYFYPYPGPVYGRAPVTLPVELHARWLKANEEFETVQREIENYWIKAQK